MKLINPLALATLVAGSLLVGNATLQAQDNNNPPPAGAPPGGSGGSGMHGRPNFDLVAKELNLTADQKPKVKAVLEDSQKQMSSLRTDTSLSLDDKKAKAKEIREATQAKLKEILTPEQLEKLQKHMQHNRPPGAPGAGGTGGAGGAVTPDNN